MPRVLGFRSCSINMTTGHKWRVKFMLLLNNMRELFPSLSFSTELICRQFKYFVAYLKAVQQLPRESRVTCLHKHGFSLLRVDCIRISAIQIYGIDVVEGRVAQGWRWIQSGTEVEEDACAVQVTSTRQKGGDFGGRPSVKLKCLSDTQGFGMSQAVWAVLFGPNQISRYKRNGRDVEAKPQSDKITAGSRKLQRQILQWIFFP